MFLLNPPQTAEANVVPQKAITGNQLFYPSQGNQLGHLIWLFFLLPAQPRQ